MDLHSRSHRIHSVSSNPDDLAAGSPDTPHRSAHNLRMPVLPWSWPYISDQII